MTNLLAISRFAHITSRLTMGKRGQFVRIPYHGWNDYPQSILLSSFSVLTAWFSLDWNTGKSREITPCYFLQKSNVSIPYFSVFVNRKMQAIPPFSKKLKFFQKNFKKTLDKCFHLCYNGIVVRKNGRQEQSKCGGLAQLGEHLPYKQRVTGSSPVVPTNGPVAQLVRAPPCHGGGREFEPHLGR